MPEKGQWFLCCILKITGTNSTNDNIDTREKIKIPFSADNQEDAEKQVRKIAKQLKNSSNENLMARIDHFCDFPIGEGNKVSVSDFSILFEKKLEI